MKTMIAAIICAFCATPCYGQGDQACRAQGPSLQETMKYVLKQAQLKDLAFNDKNGTLFYEGSRYHGAAVIVHYTTIDCASIKATDRRIVQFRCVRGTDCIFDAENGMALSGKYESWDEFGVEGDDPEALTSLSRAFSHLIYLLQADFRASHRIKDDPFAN